MPGDQLHFHYQFAAAALQVIKPKLSDNPHWVDTFDLQPFASWKQSRRYYDSRLAKPGQNEFEVF